MNENNGVETLSVKVARKIKKRISEGEWNVGDKIPNEQILAQEMNVSRTTIREAIKQLTSAGILRIERGVGTFVLNKPSMLDSVDDKLREANPDSFMFDLCEYRVYLEPFACALASIRANSAQIEEMRSIIYEMDRLSVKMKSCSNRSVLVDKLASLEVRFHTLIYIMAGNIMFQRISQIMNDTVFEAYMTDCYRRGIITDRLQYVSVHAEIFDAICKHDQKKAYDASKRHMSVTYNELVGVMSNISQRSLLDLY